MTLDRPGFSDAVHESQSCFRAVLDAMSHPGRITRVDTGLAPPAPLDAATGSVLLTLADAETRLFLDAAFQDAAPWVAFHCGAPSAPMAEAGLAACLACPDLSALTAGTDDAPELGATLILQLPSLRDGAALRLTGPGVDGATIIAPSGLPEDFVARWAANHGRFPRGVDIILCAGTELAALPRSVRIGGR